MTTSVLFDAPGPRTVRRHRIYGLIALVGVLGVLAFVIVRFNDAGQFEGDKWEVFVTPNGLRISRVAVDAAVRMGVQVGVQGPCEVVGDVESPALPA